MRLCDEILNVLLFVVISSTTVQEHAGNDKSCVWHAADFSDGELKDELFCIRFGSVESKWLLFLLSVSFTCFWVYRHFLIKC